MAIAEVHETSQRQLQDIADAIAAAKKVVVITGAGISTNCGIPDFRSKNGLYSNIKHEHEREHDRASALSSNTTTLPSKGKDLFDSIIWRDQQSTAAFYKFMTSLRKSVQEDVRKTSATHRFLRTLREQRKLVRCYTQNIDGLEGRDGLCSDLRRGKGSRARFTKKALDKPANPAGAALADALSRGCEVVQLHGNLRTLRCTLCQQYFDWDSATHDARFLAGRAPRCPSCAETSESRQDRGKRGTRIGTLRPNVILYGEEHPSADSIGNITSYDLTSSPDLLLVLGTSLHVHGLKTLVREFAKAVHARTGKRGKVIFVNLSKPAESVWKDVFDYWVGMDCDRWVGTMRKCRPDIWQLQAQLRPKITKTAKASKVAKREMENIIPDSEDSSPPSSPEPKVVIFTPKKQKQPFRERNPLTGLPSKQSRGRERVIPDSDPQSSLPTPPSSGAGTTALSRKRRIFTEYDETATDTPSKRRRKIQIWEDSPRDI